MDPSLAFLDFSTPQLVIILTIVLLLFGGKKLPELSRSVGNSMHELRKGIDGHVDEKKNTQQKAEVQRASDN